MKNESYGQVIEAQSVAKGVGHRSEALAARLETGAAALAAFAATLSETEWRMAFPGTDGKLVLWCTTLPACTRLRSSLRICWLPANRSQA
jgi:hypothetical protein